MKTKTTLVFSILFIALTSFISLNQETQSIKGEYDGHEDYGYNFIIINSDDEERTMTFHEVDKDVLNAFDLDSEDLIGTKFEVAYTSEIETVLDENGDEEENEILTIKNLKQINK